MLICQGDLFLIAVQDELAPITEADIQQIKTTLQDEMPKTIQVSSSSENEEKNERDEFLLLLTAPRGESESERMEEHKRSLIQEEEKKKSKEEQVMLMSPHNLFSLCFLGDWYSIPFSPFLFLRLSLLSLSLGVSYCFSVLFFLLFFTCLPV